MKPKPRSITFKLTQETIRVLTTKRTSPAFAGLAFVGTTSTAQAGGVNFGITIGNGYGGYYGNRGYNQTPRYYGRRHSFWHDTSHYDYHPGGFQRHGNHYHYVPGHYDYHQTGHWDGGRRRHHRH